ncbi:hypothetical protein L3X38_003178 [Prunus dulcis]|uniref:Uncharacterized protein n=1 Tax=Prunus dulcis TaxID=3755 RepID=A0AAD4ZLJ7_PRUDU|nr:hypothetical protein L3X38_003178 [Prunus dulcis]
MNSQSQELLRDYHENEEEEASNCLRQRAHRAIAPRSSSESSKAAASASPTSSPTCSRVLRPLSALSGHLLRPPFLCSLLAFHPHFLVSLLVHALSSFDDDPIARQVVHLVSALCESAAASLSADFVARVSDRLSSGALAWSLRHLYTLHCLGILLNCQQNNPYAHIREKYGLITNLVEGLQLPSEEIRGEILFVLYKVSVLQYASEVGIGTDFLFAFCPKLLRLSLEALMKTQSDVVRLNCVAFLTMLAQRRLFGAAYAVLVDLNSNGSSKDATLCLPSDPIDFLILLEQKNSRNLELSSCQSAISLISYTSSLYDERLADDKLVLASLEKYILWLFQQEKLSTPLSYQLLKFSGKNIANGIIVHGKNSHMVNVNLIAELIAGGDNHGSTLLVSLLTQLLEKGHENDIISEVNLVATIVNIFPIASDQLCLHVHHEILSDDECCLAVTMKLINIITTRAADGWNQECLLAIGILCLILHHSSNEVLVGANFPTRIFA